MGGVLEHDPESCSVLALAFFCGKRFYFFGKPAYAPAGAGYAHYAVVSCKGCFPRSAMGSTGEARQVRLPAARQSYPQAAHAEGLPHPLGGAVTKRLHRLNLSRPPSLVEPRFK